jgi:hypothetical protein
MKALKRQLMAAIAMVLVATIALGSSTYAWFAANTTVTASTMKVQAVAENGIEIKEHSAGEADYASSDAAKVETAMNLYPTSTYDGSTWVHAVAKASGKAAAIAGSYTAPTLSSGANSQMYDAADKQYYRVDQFDIRTVKGTTVDQKIGVSKVTVTGTPDALNKSLRVLVVGTAGSVIYNAGGGDTSRVVCATVNTDGNPATKATVTYTATDIKSGRIATCVKGTDAAAGAAQTVSIYLYYEGEDSNHFSNNYSSTLAELNVTVEFESDDSIGDITAITTTAASTDEAAGKAVLNPTT